MRLKGAAAILLLLAATPASLGASGQVTGLRLEPGAGRTELIIEVDGQPGRWADSARSTPPQVVLDLHGVRSALPENRYHALYRGGIVGLRISQHAADVVRVVVDLDLAATYQVSRVPAGLQVSFASGARAFEPWRSTTARDADAGTRTRQRQARRITVSFHDADIRDVLAAFAEFAGRSIVPGAGVSGTVSAEIRDQPWDVALDVILRAHGFAAQELPSGIIRVDAVERMRELAEVEPLVTHAFRINYVPVQELAATLAALRTQRGSIVANPSTNTLLVTDVEAVVNSVAALVRQLDVRTPQVAIQAKIIFVNRSDVEELGIVYDIKDTRGNQLNRIFPGWHPETQEEVPVGTDLVLLGGNSIALLGNASSRILGPQLQTLISLVLGRHTLLTFIEALQTAELSDVQAAPLITTLDNQEAEIWMGERTPIRVVDVGAPGQVDGVSPRATAQLVETGIRLRVTPHITGDRRILLQLHAERSSAQLAATEIGVIFSTQQGTTRLLVADGETAVIGGLTVAEVARTRAGIPYLMNIPYLGALFRTTRTREQKRDLLILVTPHIVDERF